MYKLRARSLLGYCAFGVVLGGGYSATAAAPDPAGSASAVGSTSTELAQSGAVSEVIVTALKRASRVQETPAAVAAVSGAALRAANITSLDDLAKISPGLVITQAGPGQERISLRGIRSAGDSQVGIYYDEAPVAGPPGTTSDPGGNQSNLKLFDVDRVEVLRGPQGTLYGAGAMGGALRVISKKPDFNYEGALDVSASGTEHGGLGYNLNGAVNVPVVSDVLAARAVYYRDHSDGWINNPGLGLKDVNHESTEGGRFLVRFLPATFLTIDASAYYQDEKGGPTDWAPSKGLYTSADKVVLPFDDRSQLYSLTANANLGFAHVIYTTSYQNRDLLMTRDPTYLFNLVGAAADTPALYYQPQSVKDATNELRFQSSLPGPIQWTVGGFLENRRSHVLSEGHVTQADGVDSNPAHIVLQRRIGDKLEQQAAFGEVSYEVIPRLTLTGGLRFYNYDKTVSGVTTVGFKPLGTSVSPYAVYSSNDQGWLYKANASYQLDRDLLVYAQVATGFRPGGVNQAIGLATALPYLPDSLTTYELGLKQSFFRDRLVFDFSAYRTDWKDMQVSLNSGTFAYLGNAGAARVQGLEAEVLLNPVRGLQLSGNASLLSAKLTADQVASGAVLLGTTGRTGDRVPNIPKSTATIAGNYEWNLPRDLKGVVRVDADYVGRSFSDFRATASDYHSIGDYVAFNGRIGVRNGLWGVYLFGNNLFDKVASVTAGNVLGGSIETVVTIQPRTVGLNVTGNF